MSITIQAERAGPLGRTLRFLAGVAVLGMVVVSYPGQPASVVMQAILISIVLPAFYVALDVVISRWFPRIHPVLGAVLANMPVLLLGLLGSRPVQLGVLTFLGLSLLITGLRADKGCEVMSIPGLLLNRYTRLACLVFSPVDWFEDRLGRRNSGR